jgi:DNA polymerase-3 subunit delta'
MQFKEIIGQAEIKKHLIQTVKENRVSHAQLFLSSEGSGALPLAIAYAQYINCQDKNELDSCGVCSSCRK